MERTFVYKMSGWDAEIYLRFSDERTQPSVDLAGRIAIPDPGRIMDLGCGPGNSTAVLRRRWPKADITGLDGSPDMIASASRSYPHYEWLIGDIAAWSAGIPFDVVFSNAALQRAPKHAILKMEGQEAINCYYHEGECRGISFQELGIRRWRC